MPQFQSGLFDKTRLLSNILMLILVAGNIFFSIQYTQNITAEQNRVAQEASADQTRVQNTRMLKSFINIVINTTGTITLEDRVKLENDIRQSHDAEVIKRWDAFVAAKDGKTAQTAAVSLMVLLANKML
jgi:hypothetical protein